jgi:hypothetical protein
VPTCLVSAYAPAAAIKQPLQMGVIDAPCPKGHTLMHLGSSRFAPVIGCLGCPSTDARDWSLHRPFGQLNSLFLRVTMSHMENTMPSLSQRTASVARGTRWPGSVCVPTSGASPTKISLLILFSLILSSPCLGQSWSGIISSSRAINWTGAGLPATLPDGETTANPWTPPVRTQCGSTVSAGTSVATLNSDIAACGNGTYLLLGPGTFTINGLLNLYGTNHEVTLRGSGPMQTTLNIVSGGLIQVGAASGAGSGQLTSDASYSVGSTSIKIGSIAGLTPMVGNVVVLVQCDTGYTGSPCTGTATDNGGLYVCGDNTACMTEPSSTDYGDHQGEVFYVESVTDDGTGATCGSTHCYTVGLDHGLYLPNWAFTQTPVLSWEAPTYIAAGVGIEDMTIYTSSASYNFAVDVQHAYACWVKGVRFIGSGQAFSVDFTDSDHTLASNNYFFSNVAFTSSYQPVTHSGSLNLFLNNILTSGAYWFGLGDNVGSVKAYNFVRDMFTEYTENSFFDHIAFSAFDLDEGNELGVEHEDNTWGSHGLDTYFRDDITCWDGPYTTWTGGSGNNRGMVVSGFQRFDNLVGNAIGTSGVCATYQGSGYGNMFQFDGSDTLTTTSLLRWGNVTVVTQSSDTPPNSGVRFVSSEVPTSLSGNAAPFDNTVPSNQTLPCSFFLSAYSSTSCSIEPSGGTGLSWWKVCTTWATFPTICSATQTQPFPPAGPDQNGGPHVNGHAYDIPAQVAWANLPVDTTYQNWYTITGSSWSNGTETLTVSGLPNITHLMGPFQLSGANLACTSGATFNSNGEILMTGSTSTTIQYALTSNPSLACTGTFQFPDVREFDERVYESDPAGGASSGPTPPATVNAAVQPGS